jgi:chitobiase/beta-hexosaminidase-like protein
MSFEIHLRRCGALALLSLVLASCGGSDNSATTPVTATPAFSVASGPYTTAQTVSITDATSGAVIYYTTDGSTPTTSSTKYTAPLSVTQSTIVGAIAVAPSHTVSALNGAIYTIGPEAAAAGIWSGPDAEANPVTILGFVTASGQSVFIHVGATNPDIYLYSGAVAVSGTTFTSALDGFGNYPYKFPDTESTGTGSFDATLTVQHTLNGAFAFTTSAPGSTAYPSTWMLNYSSLSLIGSSLAAIAGTYTDANTVANNTPDPILGATISISATGVIASTPATSGCVMSGTIGTSDPTTNIYEISYSFTGCTGATWAPLNSVLFSGLAALDPGASQIVTGANGQGGGVQYGLVLAFNLT